MPIFMDRHDMVEQTAEETARLHLEDLKIQDQYGVRFLTYWYDAERRTTFCLVDAPDKETADRVHAEARSGLAEDLHRGELTEVAVGSMPHAFELWLIRPTDRCLNATLAALLDESEEAAAAFACSG